MKFIIVSLTIFFFSCSYNHKADNIVISKKKTDKYSYEIISIYKKYKDDKLQCDKFKELKEDSTKISFYGPNLIELLAYLNNTNVPRIKLVNNHKSIFFILNIKLNGIKKDSVFKSIKNDIINYYKLHEDVKIIEEPSFVLNVNNRRKLLKYVDTLSTESYYSISDNNIEIVSSDFNFITQAINEYFQKIIITSKDTNVINKFSFKISNINNFNSVRSILFNRFGIKTTEVSTKNIYYSYSKKVP